MSEEPSPLDFLRAVYLNNDLPLSTRMRAASLCLPFIHPKLAVTTNINLDFGEAIDKAIQRSRLHRDDIKLIEHSEDDQ